MATSLFNGILLVDKPAGMSSFGVVARVRRLLSEQAGKKIKVGHTGTLDPFATGLLIMVIGDYCKRAGDFSKLDKTYEATAVLGKTSTTGDPEGEVTPISNHIPTQEEVEHALEKFRGSITQTPPIYSAIKIDGQRAYKLAREGKKVAMPTRTVLIKNLSALGYNYPELKLTCEVSSGTYIRSLVEDIGQQMGVGAYCQQLRRIRVGAYNVNEASQIDALAVSSIRSI